MALASETELIPVLDLTGLETGDSDLIDRLGNELGRALEDVGFFFITNHGVPWEKVDAVYDAAATLHALPDGPFRFIALDVETASAARGSICQLGLAFVDAGNGVESWSCHVDPETRFDPFNSSI